MDDLRIWLRHLGLEKYAEAFERNEIDFDILAELSDADLERVGLPLGPRKKLLRALAAAPPAPRGAARDTAERRHLTVMFCDVVGWTALSGTMDPEDLREVMRAYQNLCARAIARYDGFLAQFLGDGILAFFGYPRAHEDDAERAVRTAREIFSAAELLGRPGGEPVRIRVGIASGLVVVGDLVGDATSAEHAVVGETPNLAARLQALAAPGNIVIADTTLRLLRGAFECADLGMQSLKGIAGQVRVWRVDGERKALSRFEAATGKGAGAFIGRDSEVALLVERWHEAAAGEGQVVLLSGEAGIGKSRICVALREQIDSGMKVDAHVGVFLQCSPHHVGSPLHPMVRQIEFACSFGLDDDASARLAKLRGFLERSGHADSPEVVALVAELLSIPACVGLVKLDLPPDRHQAKTLDALAAILLGLARSNPMLLVLEDAHWIDTTTQDLIGRLIDRQRNARMLIVVTHRPEYRPPWVGQTRVTGLSLNRLGRQACEQLIARESANRPLPAEVVEQIVERTDGIPLFVEELTKEVLESGLLKDAGDRYEMIRPLQAFAIPASLQDALMARLDRLAPVREIAQVGAAIGREFAYRMVAKVLQIEERRLHQGLQQLEQAGLLHRRGEPPDATYVFKHALVQDAAYESLLKARRQTLHEEILDALEAQQSGNVITQPELLAHHAEESGQFGKAITYWQQAGERALRRGANVEAIRQLHHALAAIATQPPSAALIEAELSIQNHLGVANMSVHGWGAADTLASFDRARAIAYQVGNLPALMAPLIGLWMINLNRGHLDRCGDVSREMFGAARELGDPGLLLQAHHSAWPLHWLRGDFTQSHEHIERGLALYDEARHADHRLRYLNHDPAMCAHVQGAIVMWVRGFSDAALDHEREGLALARRLGHLTTLTTALYLTCDGQVLRGEVNAVLASTDELLRLCKSAQIVEHVPYARIGLGWALARQGRIEDGRRQVDTGMKLLNALGRRGRISHLIALSAETSLLAGRVDEGLERIRHTLALIEETGERWAEAKARVIHGLLLLHASRDSQAGAEAELVRAIAVARAQGALSYELHAVTALAGIWGEGGERRKAHALLAPVYARFSEGFTTPALQEAKSLLDALE